VGTTRNRSKRLCATSLHHVHPLAVRADPGGAVAHAPFVFLETIRADLKAAAATPAEGFFLFAAVATKLFFPPATTRRFGGLLFHHALSSGGRSSRSSQAR